jgi:glycosyltransferase involved in cell wall biosynthesis
LNKPKIAVLIDWYLPGTKAGGPVRSVYSMVSLLKPFFDFYIITTNCDLGRSDTYKNICADKLLAEDGIHYYYFSHQKLTTNQVLDVINQINPSLIYLNSFWSLHFSINIVRLKNKHLISSPVLLAPRGMLGKGALGLKVVKKSLFLFAARVFSWYRNVGFHATQPQEEKDIKDKFRSAKVFIAPNVNAGTLVKNESTKKENTLRMFYLSRIAKVKNLHFALEVLREIPPQYNIEYEIYGNLEDEEYWRFCENIIQQMPSHVSVNYKRELQFHEVQGVICQYHCLFLPTLNENFGHSIVESLLCGCPVIISDQTPWNDLEENNSGYAISLSSQEKFIEVIGSFARLNQKEFSDKSQHANNYISKKINLEHIIQQYKNLFNESIKNRSVNI